jgi:hypothetical protein
MKKLFLDDVRAIDMVYPNSSEDEFDIVRSYSAFVTHIKQYGLPDFISFDNDLGLDERGEIAPDGLAAAKWLVYESGFDFKKLNFCSPLGQPGSSRTNKRLINQLPSFFTR